MKLVADKRVRLYELTYMVPTTLTEAEIVAVKEQLSKAITKHKGEVQSTEEWGKMYLAYTIFYNGKAHDQAVYMHHTIVMPAEQAAKLEKDIYLNEQVIRHLLVVADDQGELA